MKNIWIVLLVISSFLYGAENKAYVNIISNAENTVIWLDGKNIGEAPILQYEVKPNQAIYLQAIVDKNYYKRDIKTTIKVNSKTIPTFSLKFEKAQAKIFFVGADAELYIDDKFIKKLEDTNRVVTVEANKNTKINLEDGYARTEMFKDIKAAQMLGMSEEAVEEKMVKRGERRAFNALIDGEFRPYSISNDVKNIFEFNC